MFAGLVRFAIVSVRLPAHCFLVCLFVLLVRSRWARASFSGPEALAKLCAMDCRERPTFFKYDTCDRLAWLRDDEELMMTMIGYDDEALMIIALPQTIRGRRS